MRLTCLALTVAGFCGAVLAACDESAVGPTLEPVHQVAARVSGPTPSMLQPEDFRYEVVRHPGAGHTFLNRMNARGDVVGDFCAADFAWCWGFYRKGEAYQTVAYPGSSFTYAYGVNERGDVVGEYGDGGGSHAYLYSRGDYRALPSPAGTQTRAYDINAAGVISGSYRSATAPGWQPAIWNKDGTFVPLVELVSELGATMAEAFGVGVDGSVVGHFTRAGDLDPTTGRPKMYGFVYGDGGLRATLDFPGSGWMSCGWGLGVHGEVVGHYVDLAGGGVTGYVWQADAFRARLRVPGADNTFPQAITPSGAIAGWARLRDGQRIGFIARRG